MVPTPSAHRSTAQGGSTGGAAATDHGAPREATESPPGVVADRPKKVRPVGRVRRVRERPAPGRGGRSTKTMTTPTLRDRPPLRGPFLHTLRAQIAFGFVRKCWSPNLSSQRAFFCMRGEHKKPVAGPTGVGYESHSLRGTGLGRRRPRPGEGRDGRAGQNDLGTSSSPSRPGRPQDGPALAFSNNWRSG